jgi:hypothetical protein
VCQSKPTRDRGQDVVGRRAQASLDVLGVRSELGQPLEVATLAYDDEGPGLAVSRTGGPAGYLEDRLEIVIGDELFSEPADLARPAQRGQDDIGSGPAEGLGVAHKGSIGGRDG